MPGPADILRSSFERVSSRLDTPVITAPDIADRIEAVCRNIINRACARVLLACSLAKSYNPSLDIRKPYTEIGTSDAYAGRSYDQDYVQPFIM